MSPAGTADNGPGSDVLTLPRRRWPFPLPSSAPPRLLATQHFVLCEETLCKVCVQVNHFIGVSTNSHTSSEKALKTKKQRHRPVTWPVFTFMAGVPSRSIFG